MGKRLLGINIGLSGLVIAVLFFAFLQIGVWTGVFSRFPLLGDARNLKTAGKFLFTTTHIMSKDVNGIKEEAGIRAISISNGDIMDMPPEIQRAIKNLLLVKDVDIDLNEDQALDIAVIKTTGRLPDMAYRIREKLFTMDNIVIHKTRDGKLEAHIPGRIYGDFLAGYISLREEVRDKLESGKINDKRTLLAKILAKSVRYEPCGFRLDAESQKAVQKAADYFVMVDLGGFLNELDDHTAGRRATEKVMEYIGVPKREAARIAKEVFVAEKSLIVPTEVPGSVAKDLPGSSMAGKPVSPTGTLSPGSIFGFPGISEDILDANIGRIRGLLDTAAGNIAEDERSMLISEMSDAGAGSIERIQAFAVLLKRAGVFDSDIGVVIDARADRLDAPKIARMINGGANSPVIRSFVLIDSRETYSEFIIMGVSADSVILKEKDDTAIEAVKMHMAKHSINIAPHNMSFTVIVNEENMDMLKKECIAPDKPGEVFNFVVMDIKDILRNHNSKLLYTNFINIANRLALDDKPSIMAIGEEGTSAVQDLYAADTGSMLNIIPVEDPDIDKILTKFTTSLL